MGQKPKIVLEPSDVVNLDFEIRSDSAAREAFMRDSGKAFARESKFENCLLHVVWQIQHGTGPSKVIAEIAASRFPDELLAEALRQYKLKGEETTRFFFLALLRGPAEWWGTYGFKPEVIAKDFTYGDMSDIIAIVRKHTADLKASLLLQLPCWDVFWNHSIQNPIARNRPDFLLAWDDVKKSRHGIRLGNGMRACRMSYKGFQMAVNQLYDTMESAGKIGQLPFGKKIYDHPYAWDMIRDLEGEEGLPFNLTRNRKRFIELYIYFRHRQAAIKTRRTTLAQRNKLLTN